MSLSQSLNELFSGNSLLLVSIFIYAFYWYRAHKENSDQEVNLFFFILSAILSIVGFCYLGYSFIHLSLDEYLIPPLGVFILAIVLFVFMYVLVTKVLKSKVKAEMNFVLLWSLLQLNCMNVLYAMGRINTFMTVLLIIMLIVFVISFMNSVLVFYKSEETKPAYKVLSPLGLIGLIVLIVDVFMIV